MYNESIIHPIIHIKFLFKSQTLIRIVYNQVAYKLLVMQLPQVHLRDFAAFCDIEILRSRF